MNLVLTFEKLVRNMETHESNWEGVKEEDNAAPCSSIISALWKDIEITINQVHFFVTSYMKKKIYLMLIGQDNIKVFNIVGF